MIVLLGIVLVLIIFSGLDKLFWASSYEEQRTQSPARRRATGGRPQARSSRRNSPARGWTR